MTIACSGDLTVTKKLVHDLETGLSLLATGTAGQREVFSGDPAIGAIIPYDDPLALANAILDTLFIDPSFLERTKWPVGRLAEGVFAWTRPAGTIWKAAERALTRPAVTGSRQPGRAGKG